MDDSMQKRVREVLIAELTRQGEVYQGQLTVQLIDDDRLQLDGLILLDELAAALVGAVAGGP